jgi:uncharacterized membrane protein YjfL (UPF0719 family)
MFTALIVVAADLVLLMIYTVVRMVLNERHQQRIQHERASVYFATRDQQHAQIEAAGREATISGLDQRAP